jgi:hypothetical protein
MADDIPFANGAGPAPRRQQRRMYGAPFGALPDIQFNPGSAPRQGGVNALAAQGVNVIASPFGSMPTAGLTPPTSAPSQYGDASSAALPQATNMLASQPALVEPPPQFTIAPTDDPETPQGPLTWPPPQNTDANPHAVAEWLGLKIPRMRAPSVYDRQPSLTSPDDDTGASPASQSPMPTDSIRALMQTVRRRF